MKNIFTSIFMMIVSFAVPLFAEESDSIEETDNVTGSRLGETDIQAELKNKTSREISSAKTTGYHGKSAEYTATTARTEDNDEAAGDFLSFRLTLFGDITTTGSDNGTESYSVIRTKIGEFYIDPQEKLIKEGEIAAFVAKNAIDDSFVNVNWTISVINSIFATGLGEDVCSIVTSAELPSARYVIAAEKSKKVVISPLTVVGVEKVSATRGTNTVTSTKDVPGDDESVCIDAKQTDVTSGSITITATPVPESQWPENQPEWYLDNTKVQTGGTSYTFSANNQSAGKYMVEARCGNSKKAINIYVVQARFILINNSPGNAPLVFQYSETTGMPTNPSVGHTAWQIRVIPEAAHNVSPFNEYKNELNKFVGFHANSNTVIFSGRVNAPVPSFHLPDSITGQIKSYGINIGKAQQGLLNIKNKTKSNGGGNYILGTACVIDSGYPISWSHAADRNCTVTAAEAGSSLGLTIPNSMVFWRGTVAGLSVIFSGHSPFGLGNNW